MKNVFMFHRQKIVNNFIIIQFYPPLKQSTQSSQKKMPECEMHNKLFYNEICKK